MTGRWHFRDHEAERRLFNRRVLLASSVIFLLLATLVGKLVNLQVVQYEYFSARSDGNRLHVQYVPPQRGVIYDRSGTLLADNLPVYNLTIVPEEVNDLAGTLDYLSGLVELSDSDLETFENQLRRSRVPYSSVPLRYVLTEEEKYRVAVNSHRMPGVSMEPQLMRHYPFDSLTAHSVGYVSHINQQELDALDETEFENYGGTTHIGKTGVERTYEHLLHGQVGYETVEKNNRGRVMQVLESTEAVAGNDIALHLDHRLQMAAEEALGNYRGAVVAIEPETGGILAMVSKPGFDPNLFVTGISSRDYGVLVTDEVNTPLFDRSVSPYPPGSTVKPFLGLAGLHLGLVDYEFTIDDPGYFQLPGVSYRWNNYTMRTAIGGGHGITDLRRAIYQSSDTFFYDLGHRMGIDDMHDFMSLFGFGGNLAFDIAYARTAVLPSRDWKLETLGEPWYPGDTVNSSIGQGYMLATPLQLATAASLIANEGRMVRPRMLKSVDGEPHRFEEEFPADDVVLEDPDYWRYIRDAMTMVVHRPFSNVFRDYGTAYEAIARADPNMTYRIAGKTGTAQVVGISQNIRSSAEIQVSDQNKDHALFIAFAPAGHPRIEPRIALAVFVENGEHGSTVAGPVAKRITDAWLLDILQLDLTVEPEPEPAPLSDPLPLTPSEVAAVNE